MKLRFFFTTLRFYFKTLLNASVTGYQFPRPYFSGTVFYRKSFSTIWYLLYGFFQGALLYQLMLRLRQQIIVANSIGIEKGDYHLMRAGSYFSSANADVREFTSRDTSLLRRPFLTMFGRFKKSRGLLVNVSSFYGAVVKNASLNDLVCVTVKTSSKVGSDYLLSNYVNVDRAAEIYLLDFFDLLTQSYAATASATQQLSLIWQKRKNF